MYTCTALSTSVCAQFSTGSYINPCRLYSAIISHTLLDATHGFRDM